MKHSYPWLSALITPTVAGLIGLTGCGQPGGTETTFITIGTGGVTGVYYPTGQAIATLVNQAQGPTTIRASAESTGGSVYNINAVIAGDLEFGIAQSDRHYQAWHGQADWEENPQASLRSVFSLHPEVITLVAADDSGITSLADLAGKRVNIGNPGSGMRGNALDVLRAARIDSDSGLNAESIKGAEAPKMLQDGRLDAFFYTVGHPAGAIKEATSGKRTVHFVPIDGAVRDALLADFGYYAAAVIPRALYEMASNDADTESVGMVTTFVTSASVPDEVVYRVTRTVCENLDDFKALHPALGVLRADTMRSGLTAPLHPGAERYFKEAGRL